MNGGTPFTPAMHTTGRFCRYCGLGFPNHRGACPKKVKRV